MSRACRTDRGECGIASAGAANDIHTVVPARHVSIHRVPCTHPSGQSGPYGAMRTHSQDEARLHVIGSGGCGGDGGGGLGAGGRGGKAGGTGGAGVQMPQALQWHH